jgi:hypothetical protein
VYEEYEGLWSSSLGRRPVKWEPAYRAAFFVIFIGSYLAAYGPDMTVSTTVFIKCSKNRRGQEAAQERNSLLLPFFCPDGLDAVINEPSHHHDDDAGDWEVEGPHHLPHILPVLPQLEAAIGQS